MAAKKPTHYNAIMLARKLISNKENWTQGNSARTKNKVSVSVFHKDAVCYSALGALRKAINILHNEADYFDSYSYLCVRQSCKYFRPTGTGDERYLIEFNDAPTTTHKIILKLFFDAAKRAKESEKE